MARPVNADAAATKQRILESATLFFSEKGAKSSVRDIAKGAGVSLAMVHHYFGSKDELYNSCVDAMYVELAELREHLIAEVGTTSDPRRIFEKAVREGFRFAREHQSAMRLMMRRVVARGALDSGRAEEFLVPFLDQASAIGIRRHADLGLIQNQRRRPLFFRLRATNKSVDRQARVGGATPIVVAVR